MSIIAIKGIPFKTGITAAMDQFKSSIGGPCEALNFSPQNTGKGTKTLYLQLSEMLDPIQVVDKINDRYRGGGYNAYIPDTVPDLPLAAKNISKKGQKHNRANTTKPSDVAQEAHYQLFMELQYKFPGLYNLSKKTQHKLLDEIAVIIADRLKQVMDVQIKQKECKCFDATQLYRKTHPHFGDFQMILSMLHKLQDAAGAPRLQMQEADILVISNAPPAPESIPIKIINEAHHHYSNKATIALTAHIRELDSKVVVGDNEETIARKKVREEMKKMLPYMPTALKQIVQQHFVPDEQPHRRFRIYGEPFLPGRDAMAPFTRKYVAPGSTVLRSPTMYNMIIMKVEQCNYATFKAMDGTVVSGGKLVIRDSDIPVYRPLHETRASLAKHFGGAASRFDAEEFDDDPQDVDMDDSIE